jgi:PAS domain S-box-containing protein
MDQALVGVIQTSASTGKITFVNDAALKIFEFDSKEEFLAQKSPTTWKHPEDRERLIKLLIENGEVRGFEAEALTKNNRTKTVIIATKADGDLLLSTVLDITDRKLAEEELKKHRERLEELVEERASALRESEENWRSLVENAPNVILTLASDGTILFINRTFSGFSTEQIVGNPVYSFVSPEYHDTIRNALERVFHAGKAESFETTGNRLDGVVFWSENRIGPVWHDGQVVAAILLSTEITERKQAEEALRESETLHRTLYQSVPVGIGMATMDGRVLSTNHAMKRISGYSEEEWEQKNVRDLYCDPCDRALLLEHLKKDGVANDFEVKLVRKGGEPYLALMNATRITFNGEDIVLTVIDDITERKRMEEEIHAYQEQLKSVAMQLALTEEKERRQIAIALHDNVGQILAMAKMKLGMMKAKATSSDLIKNCEEVYSLCERAIKSTRDLTSEISPPILYELGFEAALEWLVEKRREQHNIRVEFDTDGQDRNISDDIRGFIFQSVRELLVNTTKHSQAGRVKVSVRGEGPAMRICVEDDGVGLDVAKLTASDGFGLFNIKERLSNICGRLEIESKPGKGTRVTLLVPFESPE